MLAINNFICMIIGYVVEIAWVIVIVLSTIAAITGWREGEPTFTYEDEQYLAEAHIKLDSN